MAATSDSEDKMDLIGEEAEKEYEQSIKPKRVRLSTSERVRILQDFLNGKPDRFYNVVPDKKKEGEYKFIKRRKPLEIVAEEAVKKVEEKIEPVKSSVPSDLLKDKQPVGVEFFSMQSSINNSLQRELDLMRDKFEKMELKLKESRKEKSLKNRSKSSSRNKSKNNPKQRKEDSSEYEYEYVYEDEPQKQADEQKHSENISYEVGSYVPYIRRRRIDISQF